MPNDNLYRGTFGGGWCQVIGATNNRCPSCGETDPAMLGRGDRPCYDGWHEGELAKRRILGEKPAPDVLVGDVVIFHWRASNGRIHDLPAIVTIVRPNGIVNLSVLNNGYVIFDMNLESTPTAAGQDKQACMIWIGARPASESGEPGCWSPRRSK